MTGATEPGGPVPDPFGPDDTLDAEVEQVPRRSRQPGLTVLAIVAVLLLIAAVGIFGGIF